jgi:hypothetical protein
MICPKCNLTIPDISRYCLHCGAFLNPPEQKSEDESVDWENRILCSDGTCIGTIVDGKCRVCGMPFSGEVN